MEGMELMIYGVRGTRDDLERLPRLLARTLPADEEYPEEIGTERNVLVKGLFRRSWLLYIGSIADAES
jgi:hypothetical protein